jgi:hypothetical protein
MDFSVTEILQNPVIADELKRAWLDSEPNLSGGHEEGGFIVIDFFWDMRVIRWGKGTNNEIVLPPHKNCFVRGNDIIALFHTHPNTGEDFQQEPSLTDIRAVRDDFDLKGEFYLGEFVISEENVYLIESSGEFRIIGQTEDVLER